MMKQLFIMLACLLGAFCAQAEKFRERLYLQTDKTSYLPGETIWFKLLTTDGQGLPVSLSKVAYVELSDGNSPLRQFMVGLDGGVGTGGLELPSDVPTGYYRLSAYTAYMKNEGRAVVSDKLLAVINPFLPLTFKPAEERIKAEDFPRIALNCSPATDRPVYGKREQGLLTLSGLPEDVVSLAVSIHGGEPFAGTASLPMWKEGLPRQKGAGGFDLRFLPEYEGHIVQGRLIDVDSGLAEGRAGVVPFLAVSGGRVRIFGGSVAEDGTVRFATKGIDGRSEVVTTVLNHSGEKRWRVDLDAPFLPHEPTALPDLHIPSFYESGVLRRSVAVQAMQAYWADSLRKTTAEPDGAFAWSPDESYLLDHYTRFPTMEETMVEIIPSLRFRQAGGRKMLSIYTDESGYNFGATLVLLDGMPMSDYEGIFSYNPYLLKRVDVYKRPFIFSGSYYSGMVCFLTERQDIPDYKMDASTQILHYETPLLPRLFYTPDYSQAHYKEGYTLPDLRHTLLWKPHIVPKDGQAVEVPFSTSDYTGTFVVEVEGITRQGGVVAGRLSFVVE